MSELSQYDYSINPVKKGDDQAAWGLFKRLYNKHYGTIKEDRDLIEIHTGGWSENEELIEELSKTMWWKLYYVGSIVGGHYYFDEGGAGSDRTWKIKKECN